MSEPYFNGPLAHLFRKIFSHHTPDPWPKEVDVAVRAKDAVPLCLECLCPLETRYWFCPHCNFPVGDCVTVMPYLMIFPMAEMFRRGVVGPPEKNRVKQVGFFLFSCAQYSVFAPVYWFWMARKADGYPICQAKRIDLELEETQAPQADQAT